MIAISCSNMNDRMVQVQQQVQPLQIIMLRLILQDATQVQTMDIVNIVQLPDLLSQQASWLNEFQSLYYETIVFILLYSPSKTQSSFKQPSISIETNQTHQPTSFQNRECILYLTFIHFDLTSNISSQQSKTDHKDSTKQINQNQKQRSKNITRVSDFHFVVKYDNLQNSLEPVLDEVTAQVTLSLGLKPQNLYILSCQTSITSSPSTNTLLFQKRQTIKISGVLQTSASKSESTKVLSQQLIFLFLL